MMAACSSDDNMLETQSPAANGKLRFTATIATPGNGSGTRTVYSGPTDGTINVAWKVNDEIAAIVTNSEDKLVKDVLTVSKVNADGSATITGDITMPKNGEETVDLIYPASIVTLTDEDTKYSISFDKMSDGTTLDGTLDKIAANIDYRRADDCALTVSGDKATLTSAAKLESKLSIWKLTLKDLTTADDLSADKVTIKDGDGVTMVSSAASGSTVYLPVPAASGIDIAISATKGSDTYYYLKKNVTLAAGKYYESTVKMAKPTDLSSISGNELTVLDGQVLTGTLANNTKIIIADGATVLLKDVNINGSGTWTSGNYAGITCDGDATIILEGTNTVKGFDLDYPGIYVPENETLTIQGTGSLTASSSSIIDGYGAGIGGGYLISCGNITISGGTVTATGGEYAAGIGGGYNGSCGDILIEGGTVTATGGEYAAGIGCGPNGSCGKIEISGGTVTAKGGHDGAGIGCGYQGNCGNITITSGVTSVTATKGDGANSIGEGDSGICGTVTIDPNAHVTQN